jgi:hypothetical protein
MYCNSRGTLLMEIDRRKIISALGGMPVVQGMDSEAKAESLEGYLSDPLDMLNPWRLACHGRGRGFGPRR